MSDAFTYTPLGIYVPFHASADTDQLLVGGFGSGKTVALCNDAVASGLRVPGARIGLARRTAPEIKRTLEPEFVNALGPELYNASHKTRAGGHLETVTLPNGTLFELMHVDDWMKFKSWNGARLYIDELSEFDQASYFGLRGRLRQVEPTARAKELGYTDEIPDWFRVAKCATNPAGHDWIWKAWVQSPKPGYVHWVATSFDNPFLPESYYDTLMSYPDAWIKRYVFASWDEFGGAVYPEWGFNTHMLTEQLKLTNAVPVWMGLDPGHRHPQGALWVAVRPAQHPDAIVAIHEEWHPDWDIDQWSAMMRKAESRMPRVTYRTADPHSIHVRDRGSQVALSAQYRRKGFNFNHTWPADPKDRNPMLGALVKNRRILCTRACPIFFEQMENYRWEDLTQAMKNKLGAENELYGPEKVVKVNDDLVDVAQGLAAHFVPHMLPSRRRFPVTPKSEWHATSMEFEKIINRQRRAGRVSSEHDFSGVPV